MFICFRFGGGRIVWEYIWGVGIFVVFICVSIRKVIIVMMFYGCCKSYKIGLCSMLVVIDNGWLVWRIGNGCNYVNNGNDNYEFN